MAIKRIAAANVDVQLDVHTPLRGFTSSPKCNAVDPTSPRKKMRGSSSQRFREIMKTRLQAQAAKSFSCCSLEKQRFQASLDTIVDSFTSFVQTKYLLRGHFEGGATAEVFCGFDLAKGKEVALKVIVTDVLKPACSVATGAPFPPVKKEIEAMKALNHPGVVGLLASHCVYLDEDGVAGPFGALYILALETCPKGDLFDYVSFAGGFEEYHLRQIVVQLLEALSHCHSSKIIHHDIKLENLLLDAEYNVKLSDFGLCANGANEDISALSKSSGTRGYLPPEILNQTGFCRRDLSGKRLHDGRKVDSWAVGVVAFTLFHGRPPFEAAVDTDHIYRLLATRQYRRFWTLHEGAVRRGEASGTQAPRPSAALRAFLSRALAIDPEERPLCADLLTDPFLSHHHLGPLQVCPGANDRDDYTAEMHRRWLEQQALKSKDAPEA